MTFQYRSYDRSRSGGAVRIPCFAYFGTVRGLADGKAMKLHRSFCSDELQDVKRELLQALFKIQSCVVNLRERFIRLAAKAFDAAKKYPPLPTKFAIPRPLRAASHFDDLVDGDPLIAALQK